jgi:hypothetical protein
MGLVTGSLEHAAASSDDVSRHLIDIDRIHERPVMSLATRPFASQPEIGNTKTMWCMRNFDLRGSCKVTGNAAV